jgi:hypothetical protein
VQFKYNLSNYQLIDHFSVDSIVPGINLQNSNIELPTDSHPPPVSRIAHLPLIVNSDSPILFTIGK